MNAFEITGGKRLRGELVPQGAKNEALQVICAALLTDQPVTITNIPDIRDVNFLIELLGQMGVKLTRHDAHSCTFQADDINFDFIHSEEFVNQSRKMRGSVMVMGPLLARFTYATLSKPGGDKI
ncbi:MAG TPA: UDP-N-acetylglucosamine 1-carboxyvinyltransferase, partial [Chitinophagales bacterium]|nr:UDP-N-acetylglucosamine 1-carboxyvinyltransferase [Chitinophagales bacterium]